jgi:K+-sensing histidine kinase KdpD
MENNLISLCFDKKQKSSDKFLILPPLFTFAVSNQQEAINLLILFLVYIIISFLSPKIRQKII